ncbi:hypothetical protein MJH12_11385, partial [bacterium]|nr:hypothetical protein [bacterium]
FKVVAYRIGFNAPVAGNVSVEALRNTSGEVFGFENIHVEVELGQGNKLYKLLLERPDLSNSTGYSIDTSVAVQIAAQNQLKEYSLIDFDVSGIQSATSNVPWNFKVYQFELGTAIGDMLITSTTPLVADIPVIIDGKRPNIFVHIDLRAEGEEISNLLFAGSAYSFLGGQYLDQEDPKADIKYQHRENGNGFLLSVNPKLPNEKSSGRYLTKVFIEGGDIKEKFNNLITKTDSLSLANLEAISRIEPSPGQTYLYFGPGVESMKDTGNDRVIAVIGVTHVNEGNFGFVYLLKNIQGDETTLDFQGLSVNNNFGFQAVEDHYGHTVRIEGFRHLINATINNIDFNITGDDRALLALSASIIQTSEIAIAIATDAQSYSMTWNDQVESIYKVTHHVDAYNLPSAMNLASLNSQNQVTSGNVFSEARSFIVSHNNGNHTLFSVFPDHSNQDTSGRALSYVMDYIYLLDQVSDDRYFAYFDPSGTAIFEKDDFVLGTHNIVLDFALTGKTYSEISNRNDVLLTIEANRQMGDFRVFPAENVSPELLRGAKVFAKFSTGDLVDSFRLDRFDGTGEISISKEQANAGIELGILDFSAFMNGRISFDFTGDDLSRFRGQEIRLTELSWNLAGSQATFQSTDFNIIFEFNDQSGSSDSEITYGMKLLSAKTVITTDSGRFLELTFNRSLAATVYEYAYLLNVKRYIEYDPNNATSSEGTIVRDLQAIELQAIDNKIRAYFSASDQAIIFDPEGDFELYIGQDFADLQPRGIQSDSGELLPESWMKFGNKALVQFENGINFFPVFEDNGYVFEFSRQFGNDGFLSSKVSGVLTRMGDLFRFSIDESQLTSEESGVFLITSGVFSLCSNIGTECVPLFEDDSRLGSGYFFPDRAISSRFEDIL